MVVSYSLPSTLDVHSGKFPSRFPSGRIRTVTGMTGRNTTPTGREITANGAELSTRWWERRGRREVPGPLRGGGGTTASAVGNDGLDGSIDGATWETVESGTDGDRDGACLDVDDGDCIETPATHLSGASRFSQVVAIRLEDDGSDKLIGSDDAGTHRLWYDDETDALELRLRTEDDGTIDLSDSDFSPGSDGWIEIAWVFEKNAGVTLYRDGTSVATAEGTGASLAESTTRSIDAPSDQSGFVGMVRSIVEWNAVLARGTIETMAAE